jgi:hypothetical protein
LARVAYPGAPCVLILEVGLLRGTPSEAAHRGRSQAWAEAIDRADIDGTPAWSPMVFRMGSPFQGTFPSSLPGTHSCGTSCISVFLC